MADLEQLEGVVEDLIEVLHHQARELEQLAARVEQVTTRLPEAGRLAVVASELSGLRLRMKKLRGTAGTAV
jgi:hypothetical protein